MWKAVRAPKRKGQSGHQLVLLAADDTRRRDARDRRRRKGRSTRGSSSCSAWTSHTFCRSVLLAQNRFSDFLKATPTERDKVLKGVFGYERLDAAKAAAERRLTASEATLEALARERRRIAGSSRRGWRRRGSAPDQRSARLKAFDDAAPGDRQASPGDRQRPMPTDRGRAAHRRRWSPSPAPCRPAIRSRPSCRRRARLGAASMQARRRGYAGRSSSRGRRRRARPGARAPRRPRAAPVVREAGRSSRPRSPRRPPRRSTPMRTGRGRAGCSRGRSRARLAGCGRGSRSARAGRRSARGGERRHGPGSDRPRRGPPRGDGTRACEARSRRGDHARSAHSRWRPCPARPPRRRLASHVRRRSQKRERAEAKARQDKERPRRRRGRRRDRGRARRRSAAAQAARGPTRLPSGVRAAEAELTAIKDQLTERLGEGEPLTLVERRRGRAHGGRARGAARAAGADGARAPCARPGARAGRGARTERCRNLANALAGVWGALDEPRGDPAAIRRTCVRRSSDAGETIVPPAAGGTRPAPRRRPTASRRPPRRSARVLRIAGTGARTKTSSPLVREAGAALAAAREPSRSSSPRSPAPATWSETSSSRGGTPRGSPSAWPTT